MRRNYLTQLIVIITMLVATPLLARGHIQGYASQGGRPVKTSGLVSSNKVLESYPSCTITVYISGTLTPATIFSTAAGASKPNPFTSRSDAYYSFFVNNGIYDITFSGTGITAPFTLSAVTANDVDITLTPQGFGAVCDGVTDDTVALQAALSFSGPHTLSWGAYTCKTTDTLLIDQDRVSIDGVGQESSRILFIPVSGGKPAIKILNSNGSSINQVRIEKMGFASTNTTLKKIAIQSIDTSLLVIRDVSIGPIGSWTGNVSIGIQTQGRDTGVLNRLSIAADMPLDIEKNPHIAIDWDHWHVSDVSLIADFSNPVIFVADGAALTDFTFDGFEAWQRGTYGFYYNSTTSVVTGDQGSFHNVRCEQSVNAAGYCIYFSINTAYRNLSLNHVLSGNAAAHKGYFFRGVSFLTIADTEFTGTGIEALNVNSVDQMWWMNCFWNSGSTFSISNMVQIFGMGPQAQAPAPGLLTELWVSSTTNTNQQQGILVYGSRIWSQTGSLANGASSASLSAFSSGTAIGTLRIAAQGVGVNEGGDVALTANGTYKIGGTANFADTAGCGAGKLCVRWNGAAAIAVVNNTGVTVSYQLTANYTP